MNIYCTVIIRLQGIFPCVETTPLDSWKSHPRYFGLFKNFWLVPICDFRVCQNYFHFRLKKFQNFNLKTMKNFIFSNSGENSRKWVATHELMVLIALQHPWHANKHKRIERKKLWIFRFFNFKNKFFKKSSVFEPIFSRIGLHLCFAFF